MAADQLNYLCKTKDNLLVIDYEKVSSKGSTEAREAEPLSPGKTIFNEELLLELSSGLATLPPLGTMTEMQLEVLLEHCRENQQIVTGQY